MTALDTREAFRLAVLHGVGYAPATIEPGQLQRFATKQRPGDAAGWCKLFDDLRGGVFGCHRQGISETWCAVNRAAMTTEQRASLAREVMKATIERQAMQRQRWALNARRNAQLWAECRPVQAGDPVFSYLNWRGICDAFPISAVLKCHPHLPYWHEGRLLGTFPAMVAPLVTLDGRIVALHRTFLTTNGRKAGVPNPKKLTAAAGRLVGACIPLHRPVHGSIGIAEGIETALAARCASGLPTVASYSAGNLAAWHWPRNLRRLMIFADADQAGGDAAGSLHARAKAAGLQVEVMTPTDAGADWCDVWSGRRPPQLESQAAA